MTRKRDLNKHFFPYAGMLDYTNIEKVIEAEIDNLLVVASLELPPPLLQVFTLHISSK